MYKYRFLAPFLLISIITILLVTSTGFSKTFYPIQNCTYVYRDYIADLIWLNGSFVATLANLNINNSMVNIYGVFSLKSSNSSQLHVHVKDVKRVGNDIFIYADLVGKNLAVDIPYFVNGNLSILVNRVNSSWISAGIELTDLSADLSYVGQLSYNITDLLQHLSYIKTKDLIPIWISNISVRFIVSSKGNSAFLYYGRELKPVGESPLLPYNLTLSPSAYSYILVHNALIELNELYKQPNLLEALVAPLKTASNKTQQSEILARLVLKISNEIMPSYGYINSICTIEPLVTGLSESCNQIGPGKYQLVLPNTTQLSNAHSLYAAAINHELEELSKIISKSIQVKKLGLENIMGGVILDLIFRGPLPEKPSEFHVFYAPVYVKGLRAILLIRRGPNPRMETVKDYVKQLLSSTSSKVNVSLEKRIINGIPLEVIRITQSNGPSITGYLWPRDLNGTDYMCVSYGKSLAPLFLRAQRVWSIKGNEPQKVLNIVLDYVSKFLLTAASKGPRSSKLVEILEGLRSLEAKLLRESRELLNITQTNNSITKAVLGEGSASATRESTHSSSSASAGAAAISSNGSSISRLVSSAHRYSASEALVIGVLVLVLIAIAFYVFRRRG